jgi:hypothetical protein
VPVQLTASPEKIDTPGDEWHEGRVMTSTEELSDEERQRSEERARSIDALESFWWSQMRVARWLARQQFRGEEGAASDEAAEAAATR